MKIKILQRYVLEHFWSLFLFFFAAFIFLFVIVDLFDKLDDLLQYEITWAGIFLYYLYYVPEAIVLTIPVAVLLASVSFFRKLASSNEYVAMVGGGFSLKDMLFPIVLSVLVLSLVSFIIDNVLIPRAYFHKKKIEAEKFVKKDSLHKKVLSRIRVLGKERQLVYMETYSVRDMTAEGITVIEKTEDSPIERKIMAEKARWNGHEWIFETVKVFDMRSGYIDEKTMSYPTLMVDIGIKPDDFIISRKNHRVMTLGELQSFSKKISDRKSPDYLELRVEYHKRFAFSFASIVILFISVPFGLMQKRGHKFLSIGIGVLIGLVYYVVQSLFWSFGRGGIVPPFIACWAANILFACAASVMLYVTPK